MLSNGFTGDQEAPGSSDRKPRKRKEKIVTIKNPNVIWEAIGGVVMPFIWRNGTKMSEKIMVEKTLLKKYHTFFSEEVFECMRPRAVEVAPSDVAALNQINAVCNSIFVNRPYDTSDLLLEIDEIAKIDAFLSSCYDVLVLLKEDVATPRWGFFAIDDSETLIPFVTVGANRFAPLFYFDGQRNNKALEDVVVTLTDPWQLAYIKLCCKMQNVSKYLYNTSCVQAVSMNDLETLVAAGSRFRVCWPEYFDCGLLRVSATDDDDDGPSLFVVLGEDVDMLAQNRSDGSEEIIVIKTEPESDHE